MFLFDSVFKSIVMVDWVISRDIALVLDNFEEPIFGLFYTPRRRTLKKIFLNAYLYQQWRQIFQYKNWLNGFVASGEA